MNLILIIGIIFVGAILFLKNRTNQKKEESYSNVLFATGLSLIVGAFGTGFNNTMQVLAMIQSKSVEDSIKIQNTFTSVNYLSLIIGVLLILTGLMYHRYIKNKLFILNINGYFDDKRIDEHHKELNLSTFEFKERDIEFVRLFKSSKMDKNLAKLITEQIDEKVNSFKKESKHFQRGYTGIAPIPFIAFAGTFLKRETIHEFYEFNKLESKYYSLNPTLKQKLLFWKFKSYPKLNLTTDISSLNAQANEVVIAISVTQKISDADLQQFDQVEIVRLSVDEPCDNSIQYRTQLKEYCNQIVNTINQIKDNMPNIELIHMVYSGQSCLALKIGQSMESYRMPPVVIYQYNYNGTKKYPWGIRINGENVGELIQC